MSLIGIWDIKELEKYIDKLKGLAEEEVQKFCEDTLKEIAARTLAKIIARTPVGVYPPGSGKVGGTLRRGWTAGEDMDPYEYIYNHIKVIKKGRVYQIIIENPVEYAAYVEYGHRTRGGKRFVEGRFMMTISIDEMQRELPRLIEKKLNDFFKEYF
ncbi:HK97 gp10 family phage protein [Tepidimicrobium xylanilyticum]